MNVSGALQTLGQGLFEMAKVNVRREEDEIAFMRQKALQELGIKAHADLQEQSQKFQREENAAQREHAQTLFAQETAARRGETILQDELAGKREGARQSFEMRMAARREEFALKREQVKSLDDLKSVMSSTLRGVDADIRDAQKAVLDYRKEASTAGTEVDPEIMGQYEAELQALRAEKASLRDAFKAQLASYSGIEPDPDPEAPPGSEERTRAVSRTPSKVGLAEAQGQVQPPRQSVGQKPVTQTPTPESDSLFAPLLKPTPGGTEAINQAILNKVGGTASELFMGGDDPTSQINRRLFEQWRGR